MSKPVVRKRQFQGEPVEGTYEVVIDGQVIGTVRKGSAPKSYYAHWLARGNGFATRTEAVNYIVRHHKHMVGGNP